MNRDEEWRPVVGYEGQYEVSDLGRVRSTSHVINDSRGRRRRWQGRVLRLTRDSTGYLGCSMHMSGRQETHRVHALVAEAFIGPRPPGHEVAHGDGNPLNNAVPNLRYATPTENQADRVLHGTHTAGESHPVSVLTGVQVRRARALLASGWLQRDVAAELGCARTTVSAIAVGRSWRSVS